MDSPTLDATADLACLDPGTHLCALADDAGRLDRVAATFVGQGLSAGDQVIYVADDGQADAAIGLLPPGLRVEQALASEQLVVTSFTSAYGASRSEDLGTIADRFRTAAAGSRSRGFPRLRVAARMDELAELLGSADEVVRWERLSTDLQRELGVSSVCLYDTSRLDATRVALIAEAHAALAPEDAAAPLATFLATDEPWGLRVSGEVDRSNADLLHRLLLARLSVRPSLRLDLSELTFTDVSTISRLRSVAAGLPHGGRLTLEGVPAALHRILAIAGLGHDRLRLES